MSDHDVPHLRPVSWAEASQLSPWPDRVRGATPWLRGERTRASILGEFEPRYADALEEWHRFRARRWSLGNDLRLSDALSFYAEHVDRLIAAQMARPEIYGHLDPSTALVSAGDQLFALDRREAFERHRSMVSTAIAGAARDAGCETLVELGCGDGMYLVRALDASVVGRALGGELCPHAVELVGEIGHSVGANLDAFPFDFNECGRLDDAPIGDLPWLLATVHSIEQLAGGAGPVIEALLRLRRPPRRIVHVEPLSLPAGARQSEFEEACRRYGAMNRYNDDLLAVLHRQQELGRLRIVDERRKIFGVQAFNPSGVVQWEPVS